MGLEIMKSRLKFHKAQKHNCREVYSSPGFQIFQELISSSDNKLDFTVHSSSCSREANKLLSKMQEMEQARVRVYHVTYIHSSLESYKLYNHRCKE